MKKRGLASPDLADALALTFAYPVGAQDHRWQLTGQDPSPSSFARLEKPKARWAGHTGFGGAVAFAGSIGGRKPRMSANTESDHLPIG